MEALTSLFETSTDQMSMSFSQDQISQYIEFIGLLQKWNKTYNLTAIRDPKEMVIKHLLDSLSIAPFINGDHILDVGTGAGLPGIPLAIANPAKHFTLLDGNSKKIRFVRQAVIELGLTNVTAIHSRIEQLPKEGQYSSITTRAFASLSDMLIIDTGLFQKNGQLLAMKGDWLKEKQTQYQVKGQGFCRAQNTTKTNKQ